VDADTAVALGLAHEFHPSTTALSRAFQVARDFISGVRELPRSDWDQLAAEQRAEYEELMSDDDVKGLMQSPETDSDTASDIVAARSYAARIAILALKFGYENDFTQGIDSDARLFGKITASPSGQEWSQRFLDKDPLQSSYMTLLTAR
jgi:enoyl-CoA hydratase/carnithine racemase